MATSLSLNKLLAATETTNMGKSSEYEERAHCQIQEWKNPKQSWFDRAIEVVSWPLDKAGEALMNTSGLGPAIHSPEW